MLNHETLGDLQHAPAVVGRMEEALERAGWAITEHETRHYTRLMPGDWSQHRSMHTSITPMDDGQAYVALLAEDHAGEIHPIKSFVFSPEELAPEVAAEVYAPPDDVLTPDRRQLSEDGLQRVLERHAASVAEPDLRAAAVAAQLRIPVELVQAALAWQAAQPTQAIPLSRRGSLETLVTETVTMAQRQHVGKTSPTAIRHFNQGLVALNEKPGRQPIDASSAQAHYREVAGKMRTQPEEVLHQNAERAKTLGVGNTAADYARHQKAELAKTLGVGNTAADYQRHQRAELAKTLGVGNTAADYQRHQRAELAKTLGVGNTSADYQRHQNAERAKTLGVGDTPADYQRHRKAELAKTLGVGDTAADYARHRKHERAALAEQDRSRDRSRSHSR